MTAPLRFAICVAAAGPDARGGLPPRHLVAGPSARGVLRAALVVLGLTLAPWAPAPAVAATASSARAATVQPAAPPDESAPLPRSEFIDDPATTKDPFFPNSTRRVPVRTVAKGRTSAVPEPKSLSAGLSLKGITGSRSNPIALINNKTCAVGDVVQVKVPEGEVTLKCLEIRQNAVVVTIEGEPGQKVLSLPAP